MQILADENIPGLDETFGTWGQITRVTGREITRKQLESADILLVRSVTRVDRSLLDQTAVQFVGSATIGTDHLDTRYLDESGIHWTHAAGCNADAAAQYTLAMILLSAQRCDMDLTRISAGIVGLGNVGSRLKKLLEIAGVERVLACDPPLAKAGMTGLVSLEQISTCNLVSFHVPLTRTGAHPTFHLGDKQFFDQVRDGTLVVNSSRGQVLSGDALMHWLRQERGHLALDVWPDEPEIAYELLHRTIVATPHVAGYSIEGKLNGTRMLYQQFQAWKGSEISSSAPPFAPRPETLPEWVGGPCSESSWQKLVIDSCQTERDDQALRTICEPFHGVPGIQFDSLRKNYPPRRDFSGRYVPDSYPAEMANILKLFGFAG